MKLLIALLALIAPCFAQVTNVFGTLYLPDGTKYNGVVNCTWPVPWIGGDGRIMPAGPKVSTNVRNGALSINLEANNTGSPANTSYTCAYQPTGAAAISEVWIVNYSAMPVSLASVRQEQPAPTPAVSINPSQLTQDGATTGQALIWNGSSWGPADGGDITAVSVSNGLSGGGTSGAVSIAGVNAAADGTTKGVAAFTASDFNASSGLVSLDYTNGQKATGSLPGFLSAADWTTFNAKLSSVGCANLPALTGDATTSAGSCATIVSKINGTLLSGLGTGLLKNTASTGIPSIAVASDVYGLWSGTCNSTTFLRGDGACSSPAGAVSSVFSRTGAVTATSGDYTASQVTNAVANNAANTYSGGGLQDLSAMKVKPPNSIVSGLPSAAANTNVTYLVTDGLSATDCTVGGGTTRASCASNGAAWVALASSASAGVDTFNGRNGTVLPTSGDYTAAQVTNAFDKTAVNTLTNAAAPSSPSAGSTKVYVDSTDKVFSAKNEAGVVSHTVQTIDCSSGGQALQKVNGDGSGTCAAVAGGLVLIEQHTASASSELDFTTCISSTYDEYQISFVNVLVNTSTANLQIQASTNGGATYDTGANYDWSGYAFTQAGSGTRGANAATGIVIANTVATTSNYNVNASISLYNPGGSSFKFTRGTVTYLDSTNSHVEGLIVAGAYLSTTAVNAFRAIPSAGTLTTGVIRCYGIAK